MDGVMEEVKGLGWKFTKDVVVTGITSLLIIVAPMSWVINTAAAGIAFLVTGNSGVQYLEARMRHELIVREYNTIKNEYEMEQACFSQMIKLESTLDDARPVVHDLTTKLGALANVRATCRHLHNSKFTQLCRRSLFTVVRPTRSKARNSVWMP
ncbi:hypothetical protein BDN67DRAFT_126028 [Paxillus ammoniavirescens]|nr:hypothetical protein BDN67DRAFT_126028 [Paxillus ammoniavirescens]